MQKRIAGIFLIGVVAMAYGQYDRVDTAELRRQLVRRGQLEFRQPVPVRFLGKEEYRRALAAHYRQKYSDDAVQKGESILKLMGFASPDLELGTLYRETYKGEVKSFYSVSRQAVIAYEGESVDTYFNRMHLAFALRKALWEQHSRTRTHPGFDAPLVDDRRLALMSAIRGDCTYFMLKIVDFSPDLMRGSDHPDTLVSYLPVSGIYSSRSISDQLKGILVMPYLRGLDFVTYLYDGAGRKRKRARRMNFLFAGPPVATAQILHPEKYLEGWQPVPVSIGYSPPDYRLHDSGVMGEYLLSRMLDSRDKEREFLSQWEGDAYRVYRKENGLTFMILLTRWQTPEGAEKMAGRMRLYLTRRFRVKFRTGPEGKFIAGRGKERYYFLHRRDCRLLQVSTDDRDTMNRFIDGGKYDERD